MQHPQHSIKHTAHRCAALLLISVALASCEGAFGWVYDQPPTTDESQVCINGQFYIDASDWKKWYYLDLHKVAQAVRQDANHNASTDFEQFDIPFTPTGETHSTHPQGTPHGQYMYYFDVFGQGISNNRFESYTPTAPQPEPQTWTIALHRNNVRTNGCRAFETTLTDITLATHAMCLDVDSWQADEWSENQVWDDQQTMLDCYVPSQGIMVNTVLSSWLTMDIPPIPPSFTHNNHVMLLSLPDGTYAALQLIDYVNSANKKCCLTIKYKYPL